MVFSVIFTVCCSVLYFDVGNSHKLVRMFSIVDLWSMVMWLVRCHLFVVVLKLSMKPPETSSSWMFVEFTRALDVQCAVANMSSWIHQSVVSDVSANLLSFERHLTVCVSSVNSCGLSTQPWETPVFSNGDSGVVTDLDCLRFLRSVSWGQTKYHIIQQSDGLSRRLVILYFLQNIKVLQHIWEWGIAVTDMPFYFVISDGLNALPHVSSA